MKMGILLNARLDSTRLPGKALRPILGEPMLCRLVDRLRLAKRPAAIVLCTSSRSTDDPLVEAAADHGVAVFRGAADDVLARITAAAHEHGFDHVVSCGGDNPFTDPEYIDRLLDFHVAQGNDFSRVEGLPWGTFSYALRRSAMDLACAIKATTDTEGWGGYFTQTGIFRIGVYDAVDPSVRRPDLRLTVDTPEDFALVSEIFRHLGDRVFTLAEIVSLLDRHPELRRLNADVQQRPLRPIRLKPVAQWPAAGTADGSPSGIK